MTDTGRDRIVLWQDTRGGWMATFEGPHGEAVLDAWGTRTLPCPYTSAMPAGLVQHNVSERNPGVEVVVKRSAAFRALAHVVEVVR